MPLDARTRIAVDTCALRFTGYAYMEQRGDPDVLASLSNAIVRSLRPFQDELENHAAFFALQRWLSKWGGETLPESSRDHVAFRLLLLHLYRTEVEAGLRHPEYDTCWRTSYAPTADVFAAEVRKATNQKTLLKWLDAAEKLRRERTPGATSRPRPVKMLSS